MATEREIPMITPKQYEQLTKPINPSRVKLLDGMSHLEAYDVKAHLIRIFGFGEWDAIVTDSHLAYEEQVTLKSGKPGWRVGYRVRLRLTIHATHACYEEEAFGESQMPDFKRGDAHHMALTTAASTALKRCAINLGDQFGLSLYNNGSMAGLIKHTLDQDPKPAPEDAAYVRDAMEKIDVALGEAALKLVYEDAERDGMLDAINESGETLRSIIIDRRNALRDAR